MKRLLILSLVAAGCGGRGRSGDEGPTGPIGPIGPASRAPEILSVTPPVASPGSIVRVRVANVSSSATVAFDGAAAAIVSVVMINATSADLRVTGIPAGMADGFGYAEVSVAYGGRTSTPFALDLAPSGTVRVAAQGRLLDPRGMAVDGDGSILIFDREAGILRRTASATTVVHPPSLALGSVHTGIVSGADILAGGTGRIVRVAPGGNVTAVATGLAADPVQLAEDASGTLYWTDGTNVVKKVDAGGAVVTHATLPESAFGLARIANRLYATGASGDLHDISVATGANSVLTTGLTPGPLAVDGNDVIACVNDTIGAGAVRVSNAGVKTNVAPIHAVVGMNSGVTGCAVSSGTLWVVSDFDGAVSSVALGGTRWALADVSLDDDGVAGKWAGDRLVLFSKRACTLFATEAFGALLEIAEDGSVRAFANDLCPGAFDAEPAGSFLVVDERNSHVWRADVAGGAANEIYAPGGPSRRGLGIAVTPDGSIFVLRSDLDAEHVVTRLSSAGTELDFDAVILSGTPAAMVFADGALWIAEGGAIRRVAVDAQGNPGAETFPVPASMGFLDIRTLAWVDGELLFLLGSGELFGVNSAGSVRWVADQLQASGLAETPYGELLIVDAGNAFPIARLP